jgi:hypothetical protein
MKMFKTTILVTIFLFGLTAMTSNNVINRNLDKQELTESYPCSMVFTFCDQAHPSNHAAYVSCMERNGCGW